MFARLPALLGVQASGLLFESLLLYHAVELNYVVIAVAQ